MKQICPKFGNHHWDLDRCGMGNCVCGEVKQFSTEIPEHEGYLKTRLEKSSLGGLNGSKVRERRRNENSR